MSISITIEGHVATVTLHRPPNNFIDAGLMAGIARALGELDRDDTCRAILLASEGKHFCAGADLARRLAGDEPAPAGPAKHIYLEAAGILDCAKPVIAVMQGAAVGAGLGLALLADFRIATPESRFSANFILQGLHPGMGTTTTLPRIVGPQKAAWLLYSGARIGGEEALRIGLIDWLVPADSLRKEAVTRADNLAAAAPLAVSALKRTLRADLAREFRTAVGTELLQQSWLRETEDYAEGVRAMSERRTPSFRGG